MNLLGLVLPTILTSITITFSHSKVVSLYRCYYFYCVFIFFFGILVPLSLSLAFAHWVSVLSDCFSVLVSFAIRFSCGRFVSVLLPPQSYKISTTSHFIEMICLSESWFWYTFIYENDIFIRFIVWHFYSHSTNGEVFISTTLVSKTMHLSLSLPLSTMINFYW